MDDLEEVGKNAYKKQIWGAYDDAVGLYNGAIKKFPNDSRLLNNRCMCYIELQDYKKALDDAENMVLLFPENKKAHYRKGEVLMLLKRYTEAVDAFQAVLSLDPHSQDAGKQLTGVYIEILSKRVKHKKHDIQHALRMTRNLDEAEKFLKSGEFDSMNKRLKNSVYMSDDESSNVTAEEYDAHLDPTNPYKCLSLWVGNVTASTSENSVKDLFGRYGHIKSIKMCGLFAFINFSDAVGPAKAMKALQGILFNGRNLLIKFPEHAIPSKKPLKTK